MDDEHRYWAFISYSHEDRAWADWLHRSLETYGIPARLVGRRTAAGVAPRRLRPVFRDRADLAASPNLREHVFAALRQSSALIVICSPAAARSQWVEAEVLAFRAERGADRVFAAIVSGAPNAGRTPGREMEECFPPALRFKIGPHGELTDEPADIIAADLRPDGDGRRLTLLKLLAGILGLDLDELAQRDAQRRVRSLIAATAVAGAAAVAMGGLTLAALVSRDEARAQRAQAEGLIEFMLVDLRKKLEPSGRLDVLAAVGNRAMRYYDDQGAGGLDATGLASRARVLHLLGEVQDKRGNLAAALADFQQASDTTAKILARRPNDTKAIFNHAQSLYWVGQIAYERGDEAHALAKFTEYRRLAERLVVIEPGNDDWWTEVAAANSDLGTMLLEQNHIAAANVAFSRALEINQALVRRAPLDRQRQLDLAQAYAWLADGQRAANNDASALGSRLAERAIYLGLMPGAAQDNEASRGLMVNQRKVSALLLAQNRDAEALAELRASARGAERLMTLDPDDVWVQQRAALTYIALGAALLRQGAVAPAKAAADKADDLAKAIVRADGTQADWQGKRLGAVRVLETVVAAREARDGRACVEALNPATAESVRLLHLVAREPRDFALREVAAEAALLAGDHAIEADRDAEALAFWKQASALLDGEDLATSVDRYRARLKTQSLSREAQFGSYQLARRRHLCREEEFDLADF